MIRLLRANFARLFKSIFFRLCMFFALAFGFVPTLTMYINYVKSWNFYNPYYDGEITYSEYMADAEIGDIAMAGGIYMMFVAAIFVCLYVGADYANKTIRNKIIAGHKRANIYMSDLAASCFANLLFHLTYIAIVLIMGIVLFKKSDIGAESIFNYIALGSMAVLAFTSLFVMISAIVQSQTACTIATLPITIFLLIFSIAQEPGPGQYASSTVKTLYKFQYDFLPSTQLFNLANGHSVNVKLSILYDMAIIIVTTVIGLLVFRKKDIK